MSLPSTSGIVYDGVVRGVPLLVLLCATACANPLRSGARAYHDGMTLLGRDTEAARDDFREADERLAEALAEPERTTQERTTATSLRLRALIELDRHAEARELAARPIPGFEPGLGYPGDRLGMALIRAAPADPERAYAELILAEKQAQTLRAQLHLAWEQLRLLRTLGTPAAKAEALKLCTRWTGRLDFDEQRKSLGP